MPEGFGAGTPPSCPLGSGKEHLPLGSPEGPFTTAALAANWKKHLAKGRGGSRRKPGRCLLKLDGWQRLNPPSVGKRRDAPTKEAPKSSHRGGSVSSTTPGVELRIAWLSVWMQEEFSLLLLCLGSVGLLVGKNLPEEK